jgi:hypothetical protein
VKVFITKYALTKGIIEAEGEVDGTMVVMIDPKRGYRWYAHGNDWHRSLPAAESRTVEMRNNKIKSLKKQIDKLNDMKTFKVKKL